MKKRRKTTKHADQSITETVLQIPLKERSSNIVAITHIQRALGTAFHAKEFRSMNRSLF